jgi:hypothetical protein
MPVPYPGAQKNKKIKDPKFRTVMRTLVLKEGTVPYPGPFICVLAYDIIYFPQNGTCVFFHE